MAEDRFARTPNRLVSRIGPRGAWRERSAGSGVSRVMLLPVLSGRPADNPDWRLRRPCRTRLAGAIVNPALLG
jgi:hypothetical protein